MMSKISIDANDWAVYQGEQTFPVADPAILDFSMSVEGFVQVVGVRHDDVEVPVFSSNGSFHSKTLRLTGCKSIIFRPEKVTTDYGLLVTYKSSSATEVINDFAPPEPHQPSNLLAQLRARARREMGIGKPEVFANDTGLPGYEVDEPLFEEELAEIAREQNEAKPPQGKKSEPKKGKETKTASETTPDLPDAD